MAKQCPACNADNAEGALVCEFCGTKFSADIPKSASSASEPVAEMRFCFSCGKPLSPGAAFCTYCGARRYGTGSAPVSQIPSEPLTTHQERMAQSGTIPAQGVTSYMQPGYDQPVRDERKPAQNTVKTKKITRRLSIILSILLVAQLCVAAFWQPGFLRVKDGDQDGFAEDFDSLLLDYWGLSVEDMQSFEDNMPEVTAENSPGNPAFINVTFTQAEYDAAETLTASVSQEDPTADFPSFGIHVDLRSWNLQNEEDTLIVKRLPEKDDDATGTTLSTYDFSLASGQHEFLTDIVITMPAEDDGFTEFVVYNEETGRWEEAYSEFSEDGKTLTAYMPHFSKGSLRTLKKDAGEAIARYTVNGESIFIQFPREMKPKYKDTSHYLYPVTVLRTADFSKYIDRQKGESLEVLKQMVVNGGGIPKDSATTRGANALGLVNDTVAQGTDALSRSYNVIKGTSENALGKLGPVMTAVGSIILTIKVCDQYDRGVDTKTILRDNWKGAAGCLLGLGAAICGGTFLGAAMTLGGVAIYIWSTAETVGEYVTDQMAPMGYPTCVQDVAYLTYLCDNASNRGYLKRSWVFWKDADLPSGRKPVDVYREEPEKVVDGRGNGWMSALKTLSEEYAKDPKGFYNAFTKMYEDLSDAYFDESYEVKQQAFREGCKKYVRLYMTNSKGGFVSRIGESKKFTVPSDRAEYSALRNSSKSLEEWRKLEDILSLAWARNKDIHPTWTVDDLWDEVFHIWDNGGADYTSAADERSFINNENQRKSAMKQNAIAALKRNTHETVAEFFHQKRREAIKEAKEYVYNKVLPLLNTRLTFYYEDQSEKAHTIEELASCQFSFRNVGSPQFNPVNAEQAPTQSPLVLKANKNNKVLLETTVYHYMRFGCPTDVSVTGEEQKADGKADWAHRGLVTDSRTGELLSLMERDEFLLFFGGVDGYREKFTELQENVRDTIIPVKFDLKEEGKTDQSGGKEDGTGQDGQKDSEKKPGHWEFREVLPDVLSDDLKNHTKEDTLLEGSAVSGFHARYTYLADQYRMNSVPEEHRKHKGTCKGEYCDAYTTFSPLPGSVLYPGKELAITGTVTCSGSSHPVGVHSQASIRFMWSPDSNSYTYFYTDDDQFIISPTQVYTQEYGSTGFSSFSGDYTGIFKATVPEGSSGYKSDLYICFACWVGNYQIATFYHYVWVE